MQLRVQCACYAPALCCCLTGRAREYTVWKMYVFACVRADGQSATVACLYNDLLIAPPATNWAFVTTLAARRLYLALLVCHFEPDEKNLNNHFMDCQGILYRHSKS